MSAPRQIGETLVLVGAIAGEAVVVYGVDNPLTRIIAAVILLAVIMAMTVRLAKVELISHPVDHWVPSKRYHKRRYFRLRSAVERFLDEVRRLNRIALDARRGFRSTDAADREMETIERRLVEMIHEIRDAVGVEDPEGAAAEGAASESAAPQG